MTAGTDRLGAGVIWGIFLIKHKATQRFHIYTSAWAPSCLDRCKIVAIETDKPPLDRTILSRIEQVEKHTLLMEYDLLTYRKKE